MSTLCIIALVVFMTDQATKFLLRHLMGQGSLALGPFGSIRIVAGRLWLQQLGAARSAATMWGVWIAAAATLVLMGPLVPSSAAFVGLLVGGSLSHAVESSLRGSVTDYVCLRFWPSFNLADVALTTGVLGLIAQLLIAIYLKAL